MTPRFRQLLAGCAALRWLAKLRVRPSDLKLRRAWGTNNKTLPLRVCLFRDKPTNVELKSVDACLNIYLTLAALAQAGMRGLQQQLSLPQPVQGDATSPVSFSSLHWAV